MPEVRFVLGGPSHPARAARVKRLLLLVLVLLMALPAAPAEAQERGQVVVVGIAGLRWDDLGPATPTLNRLALTGAVGSLSVKARPAVSCASDGWLTLGAGTRADSFLSRPGRCRAGLAVGRDALARNADTPDGARLGALGEAVDIETVGPGAQLATGGRGRAGAPVLLVDAGVLDAVDRAAGLAIADAAVARVLAALPAGADLLVVGVSEGVGESRASLHVALATGPSFPRGALRSASTRRAPYVQLVDVAPTVLSTLGRPVPQVMIGQPWTVVGPAPSIAELVDLDVKAQGQRTATVPFFVALLGTVLLLVVALWRRPRGVELVALTGVAAVGASYLANLVPWWRAGIPLLGLLAIVVPVALSVAALARLRRAGPAGPAQLVCAFVAAVLLLDLLTGSHLQMSSVAGYSPLVAGRFAGIGNVAFGVLAAAVLLAASATRRGPLLAVVAVVAVAVDGAPPFGSDVGGVLSLLPSFVLLGLLRTGARVTALRLLLAIGASVGVVAVFALADFIRAPADRTHLGRFVAQIADGTAGEVLRRKAEATVGLLLHSPVTAMLPLVVALAVALVLRPPAALRAAFEAAPGWRHGLLALGLVSALGFALNDSGAAIPALVIVVALPATVAVIARARRDPAAPRTPVA
ncbi:MAG: hypothetical protein H7323_03430 [Frankiales bacterium]|nr:hypothetical protein [Frankiales bacterium]